MPNEHDSAEPGDSAPGPDDQPLEPAAEELDVPDGGREGEETQFFDDETGETFELPTDEDARAETDAWSDVDPEDEDAFDDVPRGPSTTFLVVSHVLLGAAVLLMVWKVLTVRRREAAEKSLSEVESALAFGYRYITKRGTPEGIVEDAMVSLDLGKAKLVAIERLSADADTCEIVMDLPEVYWGDIEDVRNDAEAKAAAVVQAVFEGVPKLEKVTVTARWLFSLERDAPREAALQVTALRSVHEKADYSASPALVLSAFETHYHEKLLQQPAVPSSP